MDIPLFVDRTITEWTSWSGCIGTCGFVYGEIRRNRTCLNADPVPGSGIDGCPGALNESDSSSCDMRWNHDSSCPSSELMGIHRQILFDIYEEFLAMPYSLIVNISLRYD